MKWKVMVSGRILKMVNKMPTSAQAALQDMVRTLEAKGPPGPREWRNYGRLKGRYEEYHCHLTPDHRWVACWRAEKAQGLISIFYLGSHQDAPY